MLCGICPWMQSLRTPGYNDCFRDGHVTEASPLESLGNFLTKAIGGKNGLFLVRGCDSEAPATALPSYGESLSAEQAKQRQAEKKEKDCPGSGCS